MVTTVGLAKPPHQVRHGAHEVEFAQPHAPHYSMEMSDDDPPCTR
jgi:hypothetical protein